MVAINTTPKTERRQSARFRPAFGTVCRYRAGGNGLVWDVSATGVGMLVGEPPCEGELVAAELTNGTDSLLISIRVVRVHLLETGDYFVGARFVRPLTERELEPFVTPDLGVPLPVAG